MSRLAAFKLRLLSGEIEMKLSKGVPTLSHVAAYKAAAITWQLQESRSKGKMKRRRNKEASMAKAYAEASPLCLCLQSEALHSCHLYSRYS